MRLKHLRSWRVNPYDTYVYLPIRTPSPCLVTTILHQTLETYLNINYRVLRGVELNFEDLQPLLPVYRNLGGPSGSSSSTSCVLTTKLMNPSVL